MVLYLFIVVLLLLAIVVLFVICVLRLKQMQGAIRVSVLLFLSVVVMFSVVLVVIAVAVVQHSVRAREQFYIMNLALVLQAGWHEGGTNGNVMLRPECFRHLQRSIVLTLLTQLTSKHMYLEGIVKMMPLLCLVNLVIVAVARYRCSFSLCSCSYDPYHDVLI
jgi:hypothetical protein